MEWMDAMFAADPELARAVEERVTEMRREQELFAMAGSNGPLLDRSRKMASAVKARGVTGEDVQRDLSQFKKRWRGR